MRLGSILVLFSYVNVQIFALFAGFFFLHPPFNAIQPLVDNPADLGNSILFLVQIVAAAVFILLILKYYKGNLLFRALEYGLIFMPSWIFFSLFLPDWYSLGLALTLVAARYVFKEKKNIFLLFISAIVGAFLGYSLDIWPAALFAILLSVYDYAAVFMTKHMIELAEGLRERGAAFSITFPAEKLPKNVQMAEGKERREKGLKSDRKSVRVDGIELGTGDLVVPAMLAVSALKVSLGAALATMLGGFVGIAFLFWYIDKKKGYWPALPPIVGGALLAFLAYLFVWIFFFMGPAIAAID